MVFYKELARRKQADELLKELEPSEQVIARHFIQSLFTDDDENEHNIHRKQGVMVCSLFSHDISILILPQSLKDSLAEAVTDKVLLS